MKVDSTVFLVDDDDAVRHALCMLLRQEGLAVEDHDSPQSFLESYTQDRAGCLVLDVRMPEMSGLQLQERLSEEEIGIPIIFVTGHGDIPISVRAIKAGAIDFLEKPVNHNLLLDRIREAIALDAEQRKFEIRRMEALVRYEQLTKRETQIMALVVSGLTNKEIASTLHISHRTVELHRSKVMKKMEATTLVNLMNLDSLISRS